LATGIVAIILLAFCVGYAWTFYYRNSELTVDVGMHSFHINVYVDFADGTHKDLGYHAGSLTTVGKNFIEGVLGNDAFANATHYIQYGCLSNSSTGFSAAWVNIPGEIVTGGLERAEMTYASTGDGVWTLTYQWTASATNADVQRVGFCWDSVAGDGSLAWADTFTPVTLNSGDKLTVTGTTTVT
jgi:hypothetical protein